MSKFLIAGALATLIGIGVATTRPQTAVYPEYCAPASTVEMFCINYDSDLGRYECPPPTLPCDVVRAAMANATKRQPTLEDRVGAGAVAFLLTFLALAAGSIAFRRMRQRDAA